MPDSLLPSECSSRKGRVRSGLQGRTGELEGPPVVAAAWQAHAGHTAGTYPVVTVGAAPSPRAGGGCEPPHPLMAWPPSGCSLLGGSVGVTRENLDPPSPRAGEGRLGARRLAARVSSAPGGAPSPPARFPPYGEVSP